MFQSCNLCSLRDPEPVSAECSTRLALEHKSCRREDSRNKRSNRSERPCMVPMCLLHIQYTCEGQRWLGGFLLLGYTENILHHIRFRSEAECKYHRRLAYILRRQCPCQEHTLYTLGERLCLGKEKKLGGNFHPALSEADPRKLQLRSCTSLRMCQHMLRILRLQFCRRAESPHHTAFERRQRSPNTQRCTYCGMFPALHHSMLRKTQFP